MSNKGLTISGVLRIQPLERPLRLAVEDIALSRRKHGFESRRGRHILSGSRFAQWVNKQSFLLD